MKQFNQPVDATQPPWISWEEGARTITVCQYCSRRYDVHVRHEADNHEQWCRWIQAYEQLCDSNYFAKD